MGSERLARLGATGSIAYGNAVLGVFLILGVVSAVQLDLAPGDLDPGAGGLALAREFFGRAVSPALSFEGPYEGTSTEFLVQVLSAAARTVALAAASLSLAVVAGLALGFAAVSRDRPSPVRRLLGGATRVLLNGMRSVHELIWAVLLLAAFGRDELVAVLAIAIPYAGVLGKIYAEMIDEAPRDAAESLAWSGATEAQRFLWAQVPRALPDMLAYTYYRFECALRSSAVLGFFGFPTLGFHIAASFENLHYGEVWSYLYALLALVLAVDWWSGRLRRELQA